MKLVRRTHLAFYLNGALGSGRYNDLSIKDVKQRIDRGDIFEYLTDALGDDVDLSLLD